MNKKDFKRGVEAAIKTNEAFMRKQAATTEELGKRIVQKIDEQGKIIDVILDTLNDQEKKELYELQSEYDIADLGQNEKEVLASYLLTLIAKYNQNTEEQKDYYFAVKKHLEVTDVSDDLNLALVENVDSRAELKVMFQTVCEFLFLKTGDISFLDEFENEIEYFGLTSKAIREITTPIEKIYNMLGLRGIVEHYIPAEPEENLFPDHYGLIAPLKGELIFDDSNRDIPEGVERVFENLKVVFPKQLHIDGRAIFKNCELVFDYDGSIALAVRECTSEVIFQNCEFKTQKQTKLSIISTAGQCTFKDCLFSNLNYRYGMHDDVLKSDDGDDIEYNCSFIDVDGYSDGTAMLEMTHCCIEGCEGTLINADGNQFGNNFYIVIKDCLIRNHTGNFLMSRYANQGNKTGVKIDNSHFETIKPYKQAEDMDFIIHNNRSLILAHDTEFECNNCTFIDIQEDVLGDLFDYSPSNVFKCKFENCKQGNPLTGIIKNCEFTNMSWVEFGSCGEYSNNIATVSNCIFKQINGMIFLNCGKMEHCSFKDSTLRIQVQGKSTGKHSFHSEANDLIFTNCIALDTNGVFVSWDAPCFLQAASYLDKAGICVLFNGCKFENCQTKGNYININKKVFGAFDRVKDITVGREYNTSIK